MNIWLALGLILAAFVAGGIIWPMIGRWFFGDGR